MRQPGSKDCSSRKGCRGPPMSSAHNVEGFYLMFLWPKHLPYKLHKRCRWNPARGGGDLLEDCAHCQLLIHNITPSLLLEFFASCSAMHLCVADWLPDQWQTYLIGPTVDLLWSKIVLITKDLKGQQEMIRH